MCDYFPFYRLVVIWSSASRTQAIHIGSDVVETELTDLVEDES